MLTDNGPKTEVEDTILFFYNGHENTNALEKFLRTSVNVPAVTWLVMLRQQAPVYGSLIPPF